MNQQRVPLFERPIEVRRRVWRRRNDIHESDRLYMDLLINYLVFEHARLPLIKQKEHHRLVQFDLD